MFKRKDTRQHGENGPQASAAEAVPAARHPITQLPVREPFIAAVTARLQDPSVLGLIRIANFDQLVAFDPAAADRLMAEVGARLCSSVGRARTIAHVDRDCFAVWFAGAAEQDSRAELDAIAYTLGQEFAIDALTVAPDIQIGWAAYPLDADESGNLLNRAFVSLARPQRTEEGAIAFFARPSAAEARRRFTLEHDLRAAVRKGAFHLHFQPFVDLERGRVVGAEALLRWRSEAHPDISPFQIVTMLEETGLISEVGLWTLNAACRQLREWRASGFNDFKIAVNLSAVQLRDRGLVKSLERTVAAHGLAPSQIELELTESATMEDIGRTHAVFERLREMGFNLAIDDFGSGYSSLTYLRRLPFSKLKIDREFVTQVDQRSDSRSICKALIDLTAGLELSVLAEGVERFEEVEVLRQMGCATFQGFYFARPMSGTEFAATVTDADWLGRLQSRVHRERQELRRRLT